MKAGRRERKDAFGLPTMILVPNCSPSPLSEGVVRCRFLRDPSGFGKNCDQLLNRVIALGRSRLACRVRSDASTASQEAIGQDESWRNEGNLSG